MPERLQPQQPQNNETLRQIQAAWEEAQAQLTVLKAQVEHAAAMAQAKVGSNMLDRDLDRAYRDLGEAVWAEVSKGKLQLPQNLTTVRKLLEGVTQKIRTQNNSINDLLAEGADIAKRLQEKMSAASKGVAGAPKKR
jgi:predicted  nucleic acid-binding Zn-ribbon protein